MKDILEALTFPILIAAGFAVYFGVMWAFDVQAERECEHAKRAGITTIVHDGECYELRDGKLRPLVLEVSP